MIVSFFKKYGLKKLMLASIDLLCALCAMILALYITSPAGLQHYYLNGSVEKAAVFLVGVLILIPIYRYYHLYKHKYFLKTGEQILLVLKGLLVDCIIIILLIFSIKTKETLHDSRSQVMLYFSISFFLIVVVRVLVFRTLMRSNYLGGNIKRFLTRRAFAIGAGTLGKFFSDSLRLKQHYHIELVGYLDDDQNKIGSLINDIPVIGDTNALSKLVVRNDIDEIYITIQSIDNKKLLELIEKCKLTSCQINLVSNHFDIVNAKLDENEYHDLRIISISSKTSPLYSERFKRIFDIFISSLLIAVIAPFSLPIALLIKLTSRGPVFYKSAVVGKEGKIFHWFKFRTMKTNNDPSIHKEHLKRLILENHANIKLINDLRITNVGKLLRKFSLDELPQLINVFKGDMSLVGPRPCLPYEYEIFKEWHKLKFKVIPGMTGLAQIIARNKKDVTFNDSVLLDLYYADNQSLWLDLKILFKTIPVMVMGKGGT